MGFRFRIRDVPSTRFPVQMKSLISHPGSGSWCFAFLGISEQGSQKKQELNFGALVIGQCSKIMFLFFFGLDFRFPILEFGFGNSECRFWNFEYRFCTFSFAIRILGFWFLKFGFKIWEFRFWILDFGF